MEIQPQRWGANLVNAGQSWLDAITAITRLGINGSQSDTEREQINILNTAYLLIILPIWLVLCSSYWLAERWPAGLVMAAGVVALSALVILHSQGTMGLRNYGQFSLPLVFLIPIAVALALGSPLRSGLETNWSLATPLLAILLDQPRAARRWFALLVALNVAMLLLAGEYIQPSTSQSLWIRSSQIFNHLGMLTAIYLCLDYLHKQQKLAILQLDSFAATVSHELRNPLTSVGLGLAHVLRQQERLSDSQRLALQTASQEASRCQLILGDLLAISRGDPHRQSQTLTSLDPYLLVVAIGESLGQSLGLSLTITSPEPGPQRWVVADPLRLRQVLENLIENSAKYSDHQQSVDITIAAAAGEQQLLIQLADRGQGLNAPELAKIFSPFFRASNAKGKTGSGLGLYVVRSIVETMHGSVSAAARPGGGIVVAVTLPAPEA